MIFYNPQNEQLFAIDVDDNSYRHRAIMGENSLSLFFSLPEHTEIPIGSWCEFQGERYTLMRPEALKMHHTRYFEYNVTMEGEQYKTKIWKLRNPIDGRLKFSLTAKPVEHLQMLVYNLNLRDEGWIIGDCINDTEKVVTYDHSYCWDALCQIADAFHTEFYIDGKHVSLGKVEHDKDTPLPLSYGRGNGFVSGVGRRNFGENPPIDILYAQGGERNIDPRRYGAKNLHLPKSKTLRYDGEYFEDEPDFNPSKARTYMTDSEGMSVRRYEAQPLLSAESSIDCSSIYPKREGRVSSIIVVNTTTHFYDFIDNTIPESLNYEECLIEGEKMTVIFQSGMLAGREFEVKYYHSAVKNKAARRFEIIPQAIDGMTMPNEQFRPQIGDSYAVFHCMLPQSYINSHTIDGTKDGAEWEMMRKAVKHLYEHEEATFSFTGELDGIWAKKNWGNVGGKIRLGGYILFSDNRFQPEGVLVRIVSIKDYINNPHAPKVELSSSTVRSTFSTRLQRIANAEIVAEEYHRDALQFTKRRFNDAQEAMSMIETAMQNNFEHFSDSINPVTLKTMMMLVGDKSLQFRFVTSTDNPNPQSHSIFYNAATKQLQCDGAVLQHLTLGISSVSSVRTMDEYLFWSVPAFTSAILDEPEKKYYLYAVCGFTTKGEMGNGSFEISETPFPLVSQAKYNFLVGVLNSEYNGERSFVPLYGLTEVLPGQITTDRIVSGDGISYFDLAANALKLGEALDFNSAGDGRLVLKGTLVQSQSGETNYLGCFRGMYNASYIYYQGDEVTFAEDGNISTYRYIATVSKKGIPPSNSNYWQVLAQGMKGSDGSSPVMVFRGDYSPSVLYYGTTQRLDCVRHDGACYIARINAGEFKGISPTDGSKWNTFGASFDSVATQLILAENASIAGWKFRNGQLESEAQGTDGQPLAFLNGNTGEMRMRGTTQLSTAYKGRFSDANIFYLPAITENKHINMGCQKSDLGKVCRFYNSSSFGGATYILGTRTFGILEGEHGSVTDTTLGSMHEVLIPPQASVEMTCFELPNVYNGKIYDIVGRWEATSRFDHINFRNFEGGRFPRMMAMGSIVTNNGLYVTGRYYDGRSLENLVTITRVHKGRYNISFDSYLFGDGYMVFVTPRGGDMLIASIEPLGIASFDLHLYSYREDNLISDDGRREGAVDFMIMGSYWWYDTHPDV